MSKLIDTINNAEKRARALFKKNKSYYGMDAIKLSGYLEGLRFAKRHAKREKTFEQGVAFACARLVELYDQPSQAQEIMHQAGVSDLSNVEEYDRLYLLKEQRND